MHSGFLAKFIGRKTLTLPPHVLHEQPDDTDDAPLSDDPTLPIWLAAAQKRGARAQAFIGAVDEVGPEGVRGWAVRADEAAAAPLTIVVLLDGLPLAYTTTGLERVDIDKSMRQRTRSGFALDFRDEAVRGLALGLIARRYGESKAAGEDPLGRPMALAAAILEEDATGATPPVARYRFPLPGDAGEEKALAAWLDVFDAEESEIARLAEPGATAKGLTPAGEGTEADPKLIAFYLPQYHQIPENDAWWGPGFTEWTGVATLKPQFPAHAVPNVPADLGFYDLRVKETRRRQGELARQYGIYGFCYYFYWFAGRRILEQPLELMLAEREPNLPFCLCWANEHWSRRWDGSDKEMLIEQTHDAEGDVAILDDLMPYFEDDRYIRIDGKPVLVLYHATMMPDPAGFVAKLREAAQARGLPGLFVCAVMSFGTTDPRPLGCDAAVEFPPHNTVNPAQWSREELDAPPAFAGKIYDYAAYVERKVAEPVPDFPYFPGVMPRWDNSARKGEAGYVFHEVSPDDYEVWLRHAAERTLRLNKEAPLVFINSWNEWGEGAHLEPDRRYGRQFLEATRRVAARDSLAQLSALAAADNEELDEERRLALQLAKENVMLTKRLATLDRLQGPAPLFAGVPGVLEHMSSVTTGGHCAVDMINERVSPTCAVARREAGLRINGWLMADRAKGQSVSQYPMSYVLLNRLTDGASYYSVIVDRLHRGDVAAAFGLKPEQGAVGFSINLDISGLEHGIYGLKFVDVIEKAAVQIATRCMIVVT